MLGGFTVEDQNRLPRLEILHFNIDPPDALCPTGPKCLERRLLDGEPGRQVLNPVSPCLFQFSWMVDPPVESISESIDTVTDTLYIDQIDTDTDDHPLPLTPLVDQIGQQPDRPHLEGGHQCDGD